MKDTHTYRDILQGKFKELGHFADRMLTAKTATEMFRICVENVIPTLDSGSDYEPVMKPLIASIDQYRANRNTLHQKVEQELHGSFNSLMVLLKNENLLDEPSIRAILTTDLGNTWKDLEEHIAELCRAVFKLGRQDILTDYIRVREFDRYLPINKPGYALQAYACSYCGYVYDDESALKDVHGNLIPFHTLSSGWCCPICSEKDSFQMHQHQERCRVFDIDQFVFAPSTEVLRRHDDFYEWDKVAEPWVAYDYMRYAKLCWETSPKAFKEVEHDILLASFNVPFGDG